MFVGSIDEAVAKAKLIEDEVQWSTWKLWPQMVAILNSWSKAFMLAV